MKRPTRGEGLLLTGTLITAGLTGCSTSENSQPRWHEGDTTAEVQVSAEPSADRQAWEQKMQKAAEARRAIAERYTGCVVTGEVVDAHTSEVYEETRDNVPRNKVTFTVEATKNPAAVQAEETYAKGKPDAHLVRSFNSTPLASLIVSDPTDPRKPARGNIVPATSKILADTDTTTTYSITILPRVDAQRTKEAEISLGTLVETTDNQTNPNDPITHVAKGITSCVIMFEDVDISDPNSIEPGPITWQASQSAPERFPPIIEETTR